MDTTTPNHSHVLSGHNPTLLNVVLQYNDMDMLRTLALISPSMYEALQRCEFDHLTMVVLEGPILHVQQQVVYNGADPVPADTFELHRNNMVATPHTEIPPSTPPPSETQDRCTSPPDTQTLDAWLQRSILRSQYNYNFIIPDYARNFMARARSVELVVYRRRLGTRISTFLNTNANRLKHNPPTAPDGDQSCVESNCHGQPRNVDAQYQLHLPYLQNPHDRHCSSLAGEHVHGSTVAASDILCIFDRHRCHEQIEDGAIESERQRFHKSPTHQSFSSGRLLLDELPLRLKIPHNMTDIGFENGVGPGDTAANKDSTKRKRYARCTSYRDGHLFIASDIDNSCAAAPRFRNLPLAEQPALTTALKIHIVDRVGFAAEDWCNAMPGCTIQPIQTWIIHDDPKAPQHPHHPAKLADDNDNENNSEKDIGHHFPRLTNLVLEHTHLDQGDWCGTDAFDTPARNHHHPYTPLSHFFIGGVPRLPHLQHFTAAGALLDPRACASIAFYSERTTSLNINSAFYNLDEYVLTWMSKMSYAFDALEKIRPSALEREEDEQDFAQHPPTPRRPRHPESTLQPEAQKPKHELHPPRKYNFAFNFASAPLQSRCPHKMHNAKQQVASASNDASRLNRHRSICILIHETLFNLYHSQKRDYENNHEPIISRSPLLALDFRYFSNYLNSKHDHAIAAAAIASLAQRTLSYLEFRCHHHSHYNTESDVPRDVPRDDEYENKDMPPRMHNTLPDMEMFLRLRQILHIPSHVTLHL